MPLICVVITFLAPNVQFATQAKKSQENANIEVCGHIALVVPMQPHATARLRMHHPQTLDTFSSYTKHQNKNEMKKRNIILTSEILLLSLALQSCRTVKESDCLTHSTRIGIDSCIIAHDLTDVIKKSDITTSITLHEYVMNEQGDTAIIRHYDILLGVYLQE